MAARRRKAEVAAPAAPATAIVLAPPPVLALEPTPETVAPSFALTIAELQAVTNELQQYYMVINLPGFALSTPEQAEWANQVAHRAAELEKTWEARRKAEVGPFNKLVKTVNGHFNPIVECAETIKKACGKALGAYEDAKLAYRQQALQAAQQSYLAGDTGAATQALAVMNELGGDGPAGISLGKKWVAKIVNPELVPREWCCPDEKEINRHARETPAHETPQIPGVEFVLEHTSTVR